MEAIAIHRCVEQQAATRPAAVALVEGPRAVTYRELNHRANACARYLMSRGLRRGTHAVVRMPRGVDLGVVLLAILKAGGSYTWIDSRQDPDACGIALSLPHGPATDACVSIDPRAISSGATQASPNLPVLTRGSDVACVLHGADGAAEVLVPHATLVALRRPPVTAMIEWTGEPGALDLWMALMSGATASLDMQPEIVAA